MPVEQVKPIWGPLAKELLARRDRFTRLAIEGEFQANRETTKTVTLDFAHKLYATPVAQNRYTVIWHRLENNNVEVKAVVASHIRDTENSATLKDRLERVVTFETNGLVTSLD